MKTQVNAVRLVAAVAVIMGTISLVAIRSNGVAGAASTSTSASGLANAKLPPGMCPNSKFPVTLTNGQGTTGDLAQPNNFHISLISGPVSVDVNHDGTKDTAAVFECDDGGNVYETGLWVFDAKSGGFKVLAGPMYPRPGPGGESSDHIKSVAVHGSDLVTSEIAFFSTNPPQTTKQSTTWAWHKGAMHIIYPASVPGTTKVKAAPTDNPGFPGTTKLPSGTHVAVVCTEVTGLSPGPSKWDFLDTGYWLPSKDVKTTSRPPVCGTNAGSSHTSQSVTTTTEAPTTTTTMATTTTTTTAAPSASQITIASLDAALAQQANAAPPSPGQPPGTWTVTCGPPSASLAVGSDILCGSYNPAFGDSEEVIQITGTTPSSFTVVAGPGTSFPCSSLNAAEQAAFTADGNSCTPG